MTDTFLLHFPVLAIARDGVLNSVNDEQELCTASRHALVSGYFRGLTLIDSCGRSWIVDRARKIASVNRLVGWLGFGLIRVKLCLRINGHLNVDQAKTLVLGAVDRCPEQWEGALDGIKAIKDRIARAGSIQSLVQIFIGEA